MRNPEKKISKSDPDQLSCIYINDSPEIIEKKIKSSVTDSIKELYYDSDQRIGVSNLITIYSELSGDSNQHVVKYLQENNLNKVQFKKLLTELLIEKLTPIQLELNRLLSDKSYIDRIISDGRDIAAELAEDTLKDVKKIIGFT